MARVCAVLTAASGLHARPASDLVKLAKSVGAPVMLSFGGRSVRADSMLSVLSLGLNTGSVLEVESEDEAAARTIADFISSLQ